MCAHSTMFRSLTVLILLVVFKKTKKMKKKKKCGAHGKQKWDKRNKNKHKKQNKNLLYHACVPFLFEDQRVDIKVETQAPRIFLFLFSVSDMKRGRAEGVCRPKLSSTVRLVRLQTTPTQPHTLLPPSHVQLTHRACTDILPAVSVFACPHVHIMNAKIKENRRDRQPTTTLKHPYFTLLWSCSLNPQTELSMKF